MSDFEKLIKDAAASPGVDALDVRIAKAAYAAGAAAEREACAKIAERARARWNRPGGQDGNSDLRSAAGSGTAKSIRDEIRARGEDKTNG